MTDALHALATKVAEGDSSAFRPLVLQTEARLYRVACRVLGDFTEAEDALQEAYVRTYRALGAGKYDGRSAVFTWMYRIVVRACLDAARKRREAPVSKPPEPRFDGRVTADARLALAELNGWLTLLPAAQRTALVLSVMEGMTNPEIAAVMECSEGAVEQRLVRARATLRGKREADDEGAPDD